MRVSDVRRRVIWLPQLSHMMRSSPKSTPESYIGVDLRDNSSRVVLLRHTTVAATVDGRVRVLMPS